MKKPGDYALWIIPKGKAYGELKKLIDVLSHIYSTPSFEPHITVLGRLTGSELELFSKGTQLGSTIRPFHASLRKIEHLDEYFRCLFIRLERSEKLIDLHNKAKIIFDIRGREYYMPHISLMYGNLDPSLKEKIISERGNSFPDTLDIKHIQLVSASVETDPAEWRVIKEFPLG